MPYIPDDKIEKPELYSPLTLAFVGDAAYELYVRSRLMLLGSINTNKLHKMAIKYVKAGSQAKSMHAISDELTEKEMAVYKRGRNAKSQTVPKNADVSEYRMATGFEALLGYLYLNHEEERLLYLMRMAYEAAEKEDC